MIFDNIEFKVCTDYPEYAVSKCGRVIRIKTWKEMKIITSSRDYHYINTSINNVQKKRAVHILVAKEWVYNKDPSVYKWVNHIDGCKTNNHADNLEWVTAGQNQQHAVKEGLITKGFDKYNALFTDDEVHTICRKLVAGYRVVDIAKNMGCHKDVIQRIKLGDTYFHVRCLYEIPNTYKFQFSEATIRWICEQIKTGHGDQTIAKFSTNKNITPIDVKRIRYKIRYKDISDEYF